MNVRNCRNCGRIFNYVTGIMICPACKESMEAKFQEVKVYIQDHKGVGINEVAEACDVETAQIRQWLREERLEMTSESSIYLNCESCGAPIRSGRFCDKCKGNLTKGLSDAIKPTTPQTTPKKDDKGGPKMRFI